jgi:hypothetical protein
MDTTGQVLAAPVSRMQELAWLRSRAGIRSQLVRRGSELGADPDARISREGRSWTLELYPYGVSSQGRLHEPDAAWIPSHHAWLAPPGDDGAAGCR